MGWPAGARARRHSRDRQVRQEQNRPIIRVWGDAFEVLNRDSNNGLDASALDGIERFNRQAITPEQRADYAKNLDRSYFEKPETAQAIYRPGPEKFVNAACSLTTRRLRSWQRRARSGSTGRASTFMRCPRRQSGAPRWAFSFRRSRGSGFGAELVLLIVIWSDLAAGAPEALSPELDREPVSRRTHPLRDLHGHLRRGAEAA